MSKNAYVTFLMRNDSFLPGALVMAYGLRVQNIKDDLVCLVTKDITENARTALTILFDKVIDIEELYFEHKKRHERQDRPFLFTRFNALRLGKDGDLDCNYEKIVVIDSDIVPLTNYQDLLNLNAPAGIINESKDYVMEFDEDLQYVLSDRSEWKWHKIYNPVCPHGSSIPKEITDRVKTDSSNMGVNACLWVLKPNMDDFEGIMKSTSDPENYRLLSEEFNWPEMQYATMYYSGRWTNIDLKYASFKGYPNIESIYGTHFSGVKPWNFKKEKTLSKFKRYEDYKMWYNLYFAMLKQYPKLTEINKLKRLATNIERLLK